VLSQKQREKNKFLIWTELTTEAEVTPTIAVSATEFKPQEIHRCGTSKITENQRASPSNKNEFNSSRK
jgi:hypothetical protein